MYLLIYVKIDNGGDIDKQQFGFATLLVRCISRKKAMYLLVGLHTANFTLKVWVFAEDIQCECFHKTF